MSFEIQCKDGKMQFFINGTPEKDYKPKNYRQLQKEIKRLLAKKKSCAK